MQLTNQRKSQQSRCLYCGSVNRGKGCRFGPHGVHFHPEDTTKCAYCGSPNYGKGCKVNPTSDLHIHGAVYNNMYKESVQSFLDNKVFLNELKKDFKDFECYKSGIIDSAGNKLKQPVTEQEIASYGTMVRTILRLKKYLGSKVDLIEAGNNLKSKAGHLNESVEHYKKVIDHQDRIQTIINTLYQALDEAQADGLSLDEVNRLLVA